MGCGNKGGQQMNKLSRYGIPVKIFYINMLKLGLKFRVVDGQLKIGGNRELLTDAVKAEITKRAEFLIEMLTPPPSPEMASHFGRLLTLDELLVALNTAQMLNENIDSSPVDGGWLLTTGKFEKGNRRP